MDTIGTILRIPTFYRLDFFCGGGAWSWTHDLSIFNILATALCSPFICVPVLSYSTATNALFGSTFKVGIVCEEVQVKKCLSTM